MEKGIDISCWNEVDDFYKLKKAGYTFVIIRAGFGKLAAQKDSHFENFYMRARGAGLKIGAYWYSYATTVDEALQEAKACLECIKGKKFEMPIYYDIEEDATYATGKVNEIFLKFAEYLKSQRYIPGLYSSTGYLDKYIKPETITKGKYPLWVAQWFTTCQYTGATYQVWQYTENEHPPGVVGSCDADQCYATFDYIKKYGWNGYTATASKTKPNPLTAEELKAVLDVCAGKYGTGEARVKKLEAKHFNATRIQNAVNEVSKATSVFGIINNLKAVGLYV